jgi:hypothetical protein
MLGEGAAPSVAGQHGAPARFIALDGPHQLGDRLVVSRPRGFERYPGSGAFGFEQPVEKGEHLAPAGKVPIGIVGFVHQAGWRADLDGGIVIGFVCHGATSSSVTDQLRAR